MPRTATKISTDRQVAALPLREKPYDASIWGVRGLSLRIFPSGTKSWELRYVTFGGIRRRLPLGEYPGLSLASAAKKAEALRVAVVDGKDPAGERHAERSRARTGETLSDLASAYFEAAEKGLHGGRGRPKRASTINVEKARFNNHIKPKLGARRFADLKRIDIRQFMRELATSGLAPDTVASVGRTLSAMLAFAVHEEQLEANPAAGLSQPLALKQRDRMFADDALEAIWAALTAPMADDQARSSRKHGSSGAPRGAALRATSLALRLALLTVTRRAEVAGAEWSEIDMVAKTWTIPASRHKSRRPHVVPLTDQAISVLDEAAKLGGGAGGAKNHREGYVFPSPALADQHVTEHAITRALARTCKALELPLGSPHDFRRVAATHMTSERLGIRRFVVSKVLGHAAHEGAVVTAVYDRNEYLVEKRAALSAWATRLEEIVGIRAMPSNVSEFRIGA